MLLKQSLNVFNLSFLNVTASLNTDLARPEDKNKEVTLCLVAKKSLEIKYNIENNQTHFYFFLSFFGRNGVIFFVQTRNHSSA